MTSADADGSDQPPQATDVAGELSQDDPETVDPETLETDSLTLDLVHPLFMPKTPQIWHQSQMNQTTGRLTHT